MVTGAAAMLLMAGCDSPTGPAEGESPSAPQPPSPAVSTVLRATEAELSAICDALEKTTTLPDGGTVRYETEFRYTNIGMDAPMCGIEPNGEYYDVATRAPVFGRARFNYGRYTDTEMRAVRYWRYRPGTLENVLVRDQAEALTDELPCVSEPCKDGIHGYQYNFRFEAVIGANISMDAQYDYITTDVKGDKKPQYKAQAIEAFMNALEAITTGLT
ncbi:MAG TPA: hypothetical protein VN408_37465 [Actinoplanes sp.]|nr:hypothetical protein [Actinoplanes sp.]